MRALVGAAAAAALLFGAGDLAARPLECPEGNPLALFRLDLGSQPRSARVAESVWREHRESIFDVSADGRWIVYGHGKLHVRRLDGRVDRDLGVLDGTGSTVATTARWAPDGTQLLLQLYGERSGLWIVDRDGSGLRELASGPHVRGASWAPDGRSVAYLRGWPRTRLIVAAADGGKYLDVALAGYPDWYPVWSPRGTWLAYLGPGDRGLDVIRRDGSDHRRLGQGFEPSWSPGERRLVIERVSDDRGNAQDALAVIDLRARRFASFEYGNVSLPSWSPRDDEIVYVRDEPRGSWHDQLFGVHADGGHGRQLTHDGELPGIVRPDSIVWTQWVTKGPLAGKRLFYFRDFCDDDSV